MEEKQKSYISSSFKEAKETLETILESSTFLQSIEQAINAMSNSLRSGGKLMSCGNGGSLADSVHFAEELTGRFCKDRKPLAAMALTDAGHMSCVANDFGYDFVFSRMVEGLGKKDDVLLAITTSGNSQNLIEATKVAKEKGILVVALLGKDGGKLKDLVDIPIVVPSFKTERIQEVHIKIIHIFIEGIERAITPELYA